VFLTDHPLKIIFYLRDLPLHGRSLLASLDSEPELPYNPPSMVNKHSLKHGMTTANGTRPKSKDWKRRNKDNARVRSTARQAAMRTALKAGN